MHPIVRYELKDLEEIVFSLFKTMESVGFEPPRLMANFKTESDRIKQIFVHEVLSFSDERHLERYIHYHQYALIHIMDKTFSVENNRLTNHIDEKIIQEVFNELESLLRFLEQHFPKYFNPDAKVPDYLIKSAQEKAQTGILNITTVLAHKEADPRLSDILLHVVRKIAQPQPGQSISFREMNYSDEMQRELFRLIDSQISLPEINEGLRNVMYYLNYNSNRVLTYHAHYLDSLLSATSSRVEKIERLSLELKIVNQSRVKSSIKYSQHNPPLKDLLNNHIKEEIDYYEKINQLNESVPAHSTDTIPNGFKLKLTASVQQLAYLFRVLIETKIISNDNVSQVLQFLVKFVITKKSETVSFGSLRTKFYSVESSTKDSVRNMLQAIIHHIDKN
jgi:hypothetical protein